MTVGRRRQLRNLIDDYAKAQVALFKANAILTMLKNVSPAINATHEHKEVQRINGLINEILDL